MKRVLAMFLTLTLCLSILSTFPAQASGYAGRYGDFLEYEFFDNGVIITYCTPFASGSVEIPGTIYGEPVTAIESSVFKDCAKVTEIILPDSLAHIGDYAFKGCTGLTQITLPEGLAYIGNYAFSGCTGLTQIMIPKSVTTIGENAFNNCTSLTRIQVAQENAFYTSDDRGVLFDKNQTVLIQAPRMINGDYTVPDSVTAIEKSAFHLCCNLTGITLSNNVERIGNSAFSGCILLRSITLPDCLTTINDSVFYGCQRLPSLLIPDSVTQIGDSAFANCSSLTEITLPSQLQSIGEWTFSNCDSLTQITVPKSVTLIKELAFYNCKSLTDVYFGGNAPKFQSDAFSKVKATVSYHVGTEGWTDAVKQNYGGDLTWEEAAHICAAYTSDQNYTCTADGTKRGICITCGEMDVQVDVGSARHRMQYVSNHDAACTQDGTKSGTCLRCGYQETVTDIGTATGHCYDQGVITIPPTCTKAGSMTYTCTVCANTYSQPVASTGHLYGSYISDQNATCTVDGTKSASCQRCGDVNTVADPGSATGHSYTNYISNDNFSCTIDGTKTAKCDHCLQTNTLVDFGSAGHRYVNGVCILCGDQVKVRLTGTLTTGCKAEAVLVLTANGETVCRVNTADGAYLLDQLCAGDYLLTVSTDCCVSREYHLTLTEDETVLDLKLCHQGDINGDGRYDVGDIARVYAYVKSTKMLTDYEFRCADFNSDGKITVGDTAKVYSIIKGK